MRTYLDCVPCFVRQALDASRLVTDDAGVHEGVLRATMQLAAEIPFDRPPPWMGRQIHRFLKEATGEADPYREEKRRSNVLAMSLYPELERQVETAGDPFAAAVRLAIAGNIIDFGCKAQITDTDVHRAIDEAMHAPLDEETLAAFKDAIGRAKDILYLADNAGEIVLDRLLIESLPAGRVTLVVRGAPIINDATREDAEAAGLTSLVDVIDNGSDVPGTILSLCSPGFRERFARSDLVVSKGQGNYETLSAVEQDVFFLLKVKCPVIARDLGCEVGQMVLRRA